MYMNGLKELRARLTGVPRITQENGKTVLTGRYPNPVKGNYISLVAFVLALIALFAIPALYYAPQEEPPQSFGGLLSLAWDGLPVALARLGDIPAAWGGDGLMLDLLQGWFTGLAFSVLILMGGGMFASVWTTLTDRPYLRIEADRDTVSIQRGMMGEPVILPRAEITGVHVGRRDGGTYDVLIQRNDELVPVAITKGRESRALTLKAKIERVLKSTSDTESQIL
jgi:hypothetical protein